MMTRLARTALYVGIAGIVLGLSKVHAAYVALPPYDFTGSTRFAWALIYIAVLSVCAYGMGLPDSPRTLRSAEFSGIGAAALGALGISAVQLVVGDALLPRFVVLGSAVLTVLWCLVCVAVANGGRLSAEGRDRVFVVADPAECTAIIDDLRLAPERPAQVVGQLAPATALPVADGRQPLRELVAQCGASVVVLSRAAQADERIVAQAAALHEEGRRIRTLSMFYEQWLGKLPISELERVSLLFDIGEVHRGRYASVKRMFDIMVGLAGTVVLVMLTPIVLIGNLVANRGPLLYSQPRVGKNGAIFAILKFRTMRPDGESGASWTTEDDPRITPFGRLLRTSHLDEMPQMVNILRGDLSIVGPRPEQPVYVTELSDKLPFYKLRHLVRPGLTGWAQVKYGYANDDGDATEKLQYEFYYLRHQRLALDVRIIGRTVRTVLGREGL